MRLLAGHARRLSLHSQLALAPACLTCLAGSPRWRWPPPTARRYGDSLTAAMRDDREEVWDEIFPADGYRAQPLGMGGSTVEVREGSGLDKGTQRGRGGRPSDEGHGLGPGRCSRCCSVCWPDAGASGWCACHPPTRHRSWRTASLKAARRPTCRRPASLCSLLAITMPDTAPSPTLLKRSTGCCRWVGHLAAAWAPAAAALAPPTTSDPAALLHCCTAGLVLPLNHP